MCADPTCPEAEAAVMAVLATHRLVPQWQSTKVVDGWSVAHCSGCDWIVGDAKTSDAERDQFNAHTTLAIISALNGQGERDV